MPDPSEATTEEAQQEPAAAASEGSSEVSVPTQDELTEVLRQVEDPELRMSILDLGLIYDVEVTEDGYVTVTHTLTSPGCPVGPMIQGNIYHVLSQMPGVVDVEVDIVWDPPWDPRTMASEEVRMQLGIW